MESGEASLEQPAAVAASVSSPQNNPATAPLDEGSAEASGAGAGNFQEDTPVAAPPAEGQSMAGPASPQEKSVGSAPAAEEQSAKRAVTQIMHLPDKLVGRVIGRKGCTIDRLRRITRCEILVDGWADGQTKLTLRGENAARTNLAVELIEDVAFSRLGHEDLSIPGADGSVNRESLRLLHTSTPLTSGYYVSVQRDPKDQTNSSAEREWHTWCPNCRRPLDVCTYLAGEHGADGQPGETLPLSSSSGGVRRCAYVSAIWGDHPGFVLGALVLGHALARTSRADYDRVLMYTWDVPEQALQCLKKVWKLQKVGYVHASERCYGGGKEGRFEGTFTKLHALGLLEYTKVLLLDLDLVILECIDDLFELRAPAAFGRGISDREHGSRLDGRRFFAGDSSEENWQEWSWCQGGGINAGVVLLEPSWNLYLRAKKEVAQDLHPEHIPGGGPEQDYLSRMYAPFWSHISLRYNYQLHHILYGLESALEWWTGSEQEEAWLPTRLKLPLDSIAVIHFSGALKIWDRDYLSVETDGDFAERLFENLAPRSFKRWVKRDSLPEDYKTFNVVVDEDSGSRVFKAANGTVDADPLITRAVDVARRVCLKAVVRWREDFYDLLATYPDIDSPEQLQVALGKAATPSWSAFHVGQKVETLWADNGEWYPGVVVKVLRKMTCRLDIELDLPGWFGQKLHAVWPEKVRPRLETNCERWRPSASS